MTSVKEIERAIDALTPQEFEELCQWMEQHTRPQPIDTRIEGDLATGHLDKAISKALDDEKNGHVQPL